MALVVPIESVYAAETPLGSLGKLKLVLLKQGQIEPLIVHPPNAEGKYQVHEKFTWGAEFFYAAKELGWETLLIEWRLKSSG